MFLAPTAVSFSRNVHPETSGSACASLHKISTGSGVTLYCLHMMWNKRCSSAMLLYGERVVFQGNYQGHFYMKYGLSLHLWWHPNWSFAESKKTSLDETLSWNSIGEKIQWVPGNLVSHCLWQISVKWMLSWRQRSPWPTCSLQQGHFLGTSQTCQTYGVQAQVANSVSASSERVRQVSVPRPLGAHGHLAKALEAFHISPAISSDYLTVDVQDIKACFQFWLLFSLTHFY